MIQAPDLRVGSMAFLKRKRTSLLLVTRVVFTQLEQGFKNDPWMGIEPRIFYIFNYFTTLYRIAEIQHIPRFFPYLY
jgi:hypothetical protein